ncbi:DUF937 domain-containing protein [Globicatella sp. PHS-GS-PNBC-21-1553]|uniref:DUF937 domain-containing protein n=1 Tax=Globicatella sp. PHS-GS-PNBC-21-1553 TaxID=2885764 RepID=UPI00298F1A25|nr:DUF937 domain-containing protein [Globicatella sp. PHS-GS-PNBC-21-1553]WPC08581.1 DUF937 domain-containing protein [Globicatella sp. PHS-GS-PNBC-21-1553]
MGLFDTAGSLMDILSKVDSNDVTAISDRAGIDASQASSIVGMALPLILKAINNNTSTEEGLIAFDNALKDHANDTHFDSVADYTRKADVEDGDKMLNHLFGNKTGIIEKIADTLGLSPAAVKRVLVLVAPLLIKYMADNKKNKQLTAEEVRRQAQTEEETLQNQYEEQIRRYEEQIEQLKRQQAQQQGQVTQQTERREDYIPKIPQQPGNSTTNDGAFGGILGSLIEQMSQKGGGQVSQAPKSENKSIVESLLDSFF